MRILKTLKDFFAKFHHCSRKQFIYIAAFFKYGSLFYVNKISYCMKIALLDIFSFIIKSEL